MNRDEKVFSILEQEKHRQLCGIELIASENFVSDQVLEAMGSVFTNKYAEGYSGNRFYGGCQYIDLMEDLAIERAKKLFKAEWANVQPHSGAQANAAVMLAILKPGDTFMGFDLSHGGHLTHGSPVNFSGILYRPVAYRVTEATGVIDYDDMEKTALSEKPRLIIAGASAYSRDWDYARMRSIADKIGAILMADISHPAGLIATGLLNHPFPHCHIVTTTTHKTLRGPRGGMILIGKDFENPWGIKSPKGDLKTMAQLLDSAVFPGIQGGPLEHVIAAKAVAFGEDLTDSYLTYTKQVQKNAQVMANSLINKGYKVISGGTDNHLMLVDLRTKFPDLNGKVAQKTLEKADITINKNMVPFDSRSPFLTSGIRLGTSAVTTRGVKEAEIETIVELIDNVLSNIDSETMITKVRQRVNEMMMNNPLYAW